MRAVVRALSGGLVAAVCAVVVPLFPTGAGATDRITGPITGSITGRTTVHLVTLAHDAFASRAALVARQDAVLDRAGVATPPVYHWTDALNGFAVALTDEQVAALREDPAVIAVEENEVRPLAGVPGPVRPVPGATDGRGGRGAVVGIVDSGISPDSPLFSGAADLGRPARGFRGACQPGEGWSVDTCQDKLVGARWFVAGYGVDALRSSSSLSARDDSGHGTQMASVAAGNAEVSVDVPGQRFADYAGVAPQARIAVYKACWTAPDPADDGCATADLVTAIDRATRDGVDVLSLAVGGPSHPDTVERALLGAAEAGIVVVAAAGNDGRSAYAAHASPWVLTVGATTTDQRRGRLVPLGSAGAMASTRPVGPARLVVGADVAASSATRRDARRCVPGSLDASRVRGTIVVCERGGLGRVEKSEAVRQADGRGMVLLNTGAGTLEADLHAVPTLHLGAAAGRELLAWHRDHPRVRVTVRPEGVRRTEPEVTPWSSSGDPTGVVVKPDLVAPGVGLLGAVPPGVRGTSWDFLSGTSAATAWATGQVLRLVARHPRWTEDQVRSALVTTASSVGGGPALLREGAGVPSPRAADRPVLAFLAEPGAYRRWLEGGAAPNSPSVLLSDDAGSTRRTVTNTSGRTVTVTAAASGFASHEVTVSPAVVTLAPGESATVRIVVAHVAGVHPTDDGWVTWTGPGVRARVPVVIDR